MVQNGHAFTTPEETIAIHEEWFKDQSWIWEGTVIHKVIAEDMAMAFIKYDYRPKPEAKSFSTWLVYVFKIEDGQWKIVHDQNTALDYHAFTKANGMGE